MESRARHAQLVNHPLHVLGPDSSSLGSVAPVALEVSEMLVLYVTAQRITHYLALGLAGCAGKRLRLRGELIRDRH